MITFRFVMADGSPSGIERLKAALMRMPRLQCDIMLHAVVDRGVARLSCVLEAWDGVVTFGELHRALLPHVRTCSHVTYSGCDANILHRPSEEPPLPTEPPLVGEPTLASSADCRPL